MADSGRTVFGSPGGLPSYPQIEYTLTRYAVAQTLTSASTRPVMEEFYVGNYGSLQTLPFDDGVVSVIDEGGGLGPELAFLTEAAWLIRYRVAFGTSAGASVPASDVRLELEILEAGLQATLPIKTDANNAAGATFNVFQGSHVCKTSPASYLTAAIKALGGGNVHLRYFELFLCRI